MSTVSNKTTAARKVVGNKTTEILIGSSVAKLQMAVKGIHEAAELAKGLGTLVDEGTLKVTNLEQEIADLQQDLINKKAQARIELEQQFKQDQAELAQSYLDRQGKMAIDADDYNNLREQLANLKANKDKEIAAEVGKAKGMMEANYANQKKIYELEATTKEAEKTAQIKQLEQQVVFLNKQVADWQQAVASERAAGIERSKHGAVGTINVGESPRK